MTQQTIPIINIAPFLEENEASGKTAVVNAIRQACEEIGFFIIIGHGIGDELLNRMYTISRQFFDLPAAEKNQVAQTGDELGGLMFFPMESESLAASIGLKTPGDIKESLDYGPGFYGDAWPRDFPELRQVWVEYYAAMSGLAGHLRRIFALGIGLAEDYFEDKFDNHHSSLRVLNYPSQAVDPQPGQLRAGAHSDYGFLTILRSESTGLQAQHRDGRWLEVPTIPDSFVVNIGDAMMRWTNDAWVSTLHRVVNPETAVRHRSRRQSIPFFHNPNKTAVIQCLSPFVSPANPAKYEPMTYGEYAELKYRQAHGKENG